MIVLVTGGTGSLGNQLVPLILDRLSMGSRVRVLSRGEHKQIEMESRINSERLDFFVGDVRDRDRMRMATRGVSVVYHLAAIKSVDKAEYNPHEAVATNIEGTWNVIQACIENGVKKAIMTSTDKAVEPLNIYGASKLSAEKLWVQSNAYSGKDGCSFTAVRYGNVMGSSGSVIAKWKRAIEMSDTPIITEPEMTRFFILQEDAAEFIISRIGSCGEVFIPKMKSTTMEGLYSAFQKASGYHLQCAIGGIRPGEKKHETLISENEVGLVRQLDGAFVRYPSSKDFPVQMRGELLSSKYNSGYTSSNATKFKEEELVKMIRALL